MSGRVATAARPWVAFAAATGLLVALEAWIVSTAAFGRSPDVIAAAITFDLVAGLPLLGWLTLVRRGRAPLLSLVPLAIAGGLLAAVVLPRDRQAAVSALGALLPVVEIGVVALLAVRARRVVRRYRQVRAAHDDADGALEEALGDVLGSPRLAALVVGELGLLRYGIAGWTRSTPAPAADEFAYHRRGSYPALLAVVAVVAVFETLGVHILLSLWEPAAAWGVTALGIYGFAWVAGDFHAGRLHPIRIDGDALVLRTGLRWRARVPLDAIAALGDEPPPAGEARVAFVYVGQPDLWLELDRPLTVRGPLGVERTTRHLGVGVDDPAAFRARLESRIADRDGDAGGPSGAL